MKLLNKKRWSNTIMLLVIMSVCLIIWNVLFPTGISCFVSSLFFCITSLTGYMYGDKYIAYTKEFTEESNQKEKWFHLCFVTGIIPVLYVLFLKPSIVGISSVYTFVIGCLIFVCAFIVVLKKIFKNCRKLLLELKTVKSLLVIFWILFFGTSFLNINFYFDYNYKEETISVNAINHMDNWKLPVYRTQYVFIDEEGKEHIINHTYVALSNLEDSEFLTVRSGKGLFGLAYENVLVNEGQLGKRLIEAVYTPPNE